MTEDELFLQQARLVSSTWSSFRKRRSFRTAFNLTAVLFILKMIFHENGAYSYKLESRLPILSLISLIY